MRFVRRWMLALVLLMVAWWPHIATGQLAQAPNYPRDLTTDIAPNPFQFNSVIDIQTAFNAARTAENVQLVTALPMLQLPKQVDWDLMSDNARGL